MSKPDTMFIAFSNGGILPADIAGGREKKVGAHEPVRVPGSYGRSLVADRLAYEASEATMARAARKRPSSETDKREADLSRVAADLAWREKILAKAKADLDARAAEVEKAEAAVSERENAATEAEAALSAREDAVKTAEASLEAQRNAPGAGGEGADQSGEG